MMARRPAPVTFDALAFLRMLGRDVRKNPGAWANLVRTHPRFGEDCARLIQSLHMLKNKRQVNPPKKHGNIPL